tara:strand:- start:452 stop:847 length:396 start_codon:yes stop_codon:yes gene_type:complete
MILIKKLLRSYKIIKIGDWFVILLFCVLIVISIKSLWNLPKGEYLEIYKKNEILATYSLNQKITKKINGMKGVTEIMIDNGKVRFSESLCPKKYCIHQGWINKTNQMVVCIPNQISISIIGAKRGYDTINY